MIMKMNMILHDYSLYDKKINQIPLLEMMKTDKESTQSNMIDILLATSW